MEAATPTPWHVVMEFVRIDLEDDAVLDALAPAPELDVIWSSSEGIVTADATAMSTTPAGAIAAVRQAASSAAPSSEFVRLVDPLVAISDIAEEAGVSRQAVRNWALGTRQSGFPRPLAIVGDGIRVWRLADVDPWLTANLSLGSGRMYPSARFVAGYDAQQRSGAPPFGSDDRNVDDPPTPESGHSVEWYEGFTRTETKKVSRRAAETERPAPSRAPSTAR